MNFFDGGEHVFGAAEDCDGEKGPITDSRTSQGPKTLAEPFSFTTTWNSPKIVRKKYDSFRP